MQTNRRELARDTATDRVGEIMHIGREHGTPIEVWLRPVGGGEEWTTKPEHVERIGHDDGQVTPW